MAGKRTHGRPLPDGHPFKGGCIILGSKIPEAWKEHFRKKKQEQQKAQPDSLPPFEVEAHKSLEVSLHRLYEQHTGQPWREDGSQDLASDSLPPFEAEAHRTYEDAMWVRYERATGNKRPPDAPKRPSQDEDK